MFKIRRLALVAREISPCEGPLGRSTDHLTSVVEVGHVFHSTRWKNLTESEGAVRLVAVMSTPPIPEPPFDRRTLEQLWRRERRWLAAVLLAHQPAGLELDDLLQEVAVRFVSRSGELRDGDRLRPWLRTIAVHVARDARRRVERERGRRETESALESVADPRQAQGPDRATRDACDRLLELATRLPEHYREPLFLRCFESLSTAEIAARMELPPSTVETRLVRARQRVRDEFARSLDSAPADSTRNQTP